ncbi:uncharacterized protein LOC128677747 isoform X3 [Plodia interpunctella]|uniref:uncharacterized protein LOC128677747 isoform X3 n=2 Tax=Plodia interpunctella TaxID=58824 RepID=UPI002367AA93|nr:uncharacterized protein LOC128677747 isoform X3 [Plodia interpunctella]
MMLSCWQILVLASVAMAAPQDRYVHVVDNTAGQIVDPGFYQPSNPNLGTGPLVDPGFYQPSNPDLGTGQIVDPGFYQPSNPNPEYQPSLYPNPGYQPSLYPNPGYPPISTGPALVEDPPAPHWSQTLYPSGGVARNAQ